MKRVSTYTLFLATLFALLQPALTARAQAQKPAVVVSIASFDETMADLNYFGQATGAGQFIGIVQLMTGPYKQGMDTTKPSGVIVNFNNGMPVGMAFIPVKNLNQLLSAVSAQLGPAQDVGGGIKQLNGPTPLFLKENAGYAFVTNARENLNSLPQNPASLLAGADKKYNLAVTVNVPSIPQNMRNTFMQGMRDSIETQLQNDVVEDEVQRAVQERVARNSVEQISKILTEANEFTIGWAIDAASKATYLDVNMTAQPGTELATQFGALSGLTTNFAGFARPAAANVNFTAKMTAADKDQMTFLLNSIRQKANDEIDNDENLDDNARAAAKDVLSAFFDAFTGTVNEGTIDGGAILSVAGEQLQFASGMHVADGQAFNNAFLKAIELAKEEPDFPEVQLDAATHAGVNFHTMLIPLPDPDAQKVFGESLEVAVGTGAKSVYLAFGPGSMDLVKQAIDQSAQQANKAAQPAQMIVSLTPLVRLGSQLKPDDETMTTLLAALEQAAGKDHVSVVANAIPNGFTYRLQIEEGVLRMIGSAVVANMQRQQGGF